MTRLWLSAVVVWPLVTGAGFAWLEVHANAPGEAADAPVDWPSAVKLSRADGRSTFVMLAHPRCPCTRAGLHELARVMAEVQGRADAWVFFLDPHDGDANWTSGASWDIARAIPDVHAVADPDGQTAMQLGAHTSGQVVAYDAHGTLTFSGGITGSRGHEGDNDGHSLLVASVLPGARRATAAVFGCALGVD